MGSVLPFLRSDAQRRSPTYVSVFRSVFRFYPQKTTLAYLARGDSRVIQRYSGINVFRIIQKKRWIFSKLLRIILDYSQSIRSENRLKMHSNYSTLLHNICNKVMKTEFEYRYSFQRKIFRKFVLNFDPLHRCYPLRRESHVKITVFICRISLN